MIVGLFIYGRGVDRNKNEHSSTFSLGNMVILPILGGFGMVWYGRRTCNARLLKAVRSAPTTLYSRALTGT